MQERFRTSSELCRRGLESWTPSLCLHASRAHTLALQLLPSCVTSSHVHALSGPSWPSGPDTARTCWPPCNHSLFDKVQALEGENSRLKEQLRELKDALGQAEERAQAAEESAAAGANAQGGAEGDAGDLPGAGGPAVEQMNKEQLMGVVQVSSLTCKLLLRVVQLCVRLCVCRSYVYVRACMCACWTGGARHMVWGTCEQ